MTRCDGAAAAGDPVSVRVEGGGIAEVVEVDGVGSVPVRYERCPAGWQVSFTLTVPEVNDLGVVHRLVAPSLKEARRLVPVAVSFLLGRPVDVPLLPF